ncbi:MAG: DUF3048 domain-containing protein [Acidimicrobiales bacterium]|nr:DUF3048 domain-containing protein [Acidimicrobiales bacterium]
MSIARIFKLTKISLIVFAGFLSLISCGGSEKITVEATTTTSSLSTLSPTTSPVVATTTTIETVLATTTTIIDPEEWVGPRHPLTGLPALEGIIPRPALTVKIGNNDSNSLPHEGLAAADIVYETLIEAGKTRFLGIYQSSLPERIAPVRSARSTDISLIGNLSNPHFAYWGSNEGVGAEVEEAERSGTFIRQSAEINSSGAFSRDPSRGNPPYDGVLNPAYLIGDLPAPAPIAIFDYGALPVSAVSTLGLRWETGGRIVEYLWDQQSSKWKRFQDGSPLIGSDGIQLESENVLLLYVDYFRSNADPNSPQAQSTGSGDGWLLRNGKIVGITWDRQFEALKWSFYDDDSGESVSLDHGRTWVVLAQLGEASLLTPMEAAVLTG